VSASNADTRAREALGRTFVRVYTRQTEYRTLFGRFANWSELSQRGAMLGPRQTVRSSNADASHWFLSLGDLDTGVICDGTGELFDEEPGDRRPICRSPK
jgi:hypothetical protein